MATTNIKLYSLGYTQAKTYLAATLFVAGNIALPQLFHLVPQGGVTWLPIYFFTLIGAYKYGWRVGLLTALLSPLVNSALFGMPAPAVLPEILVKSAMLAVSAGWAAHRFGRVSVPILVGVVLSYQLAGTLAEWAIKGSLHTALQDFRLAIPGMLLQVAGGYLMIGHILKK
ncbi:ECF transporter S component [uncultured Alistipes sp.]|jgi:hypothetical protein|uniref:ECF transporter S component n=1 Tax=uncultured Alistipes sp. TaxID=538949 RepID=UPI0025D6FE6D|nr:ECF transporter S component [uncultured Alistipes sp.]